MIYSTVAAATLALMILVIWAYLVEIQLAIKATATTYTGEE
jgi:hypothetical protein